MALVINNRVQETTTSTGTGTITLSGAVSQFQSFSTGIGDGNSTYYVIADQSGINWEIGQGTYIASNNSLIRSSGLVTSSSNNNNIVNFTSGTKSVFSTYTARSSVIASPYTYNTNTPSLSLDFVNCPKLDPRISFSRSSTATYYDGKTTALGEQNLFLNSNSFANTSSWITSNGTISSGISDPLGNSNAFNFTATSNNATILQSVIVSSYNYSQTLSFYIQRTQGTGNVNFYISGTGYSTNTITQDINTNWTRYSNTYTINTSAGGLTLNYGIQLENAGDSVNIYSAQLENRNFVTPDNITTSQYLTVYFPQLMTAPINTARFDYNPTTSQSLGLLLEESRTAVSLGSGRSSQCPVTTSGSSVQPTSVINATTEVFALPDGTMGNCSKIDFTTVPATQPGGQTTTDCRARIISAQTSPVAPWVVSFYYKIPGIVNGWKYFSTSATVGSGNVYYDIAAASFDGQTLFGKIIYITFAQIEAGPYSTSYISTPSGTAVTRAADNASMTGNNFSSWFNQFSGTFFLNVDTPSNTSSTNYFFVIAAGDDSSSGYILGNSTYSKFKTITSGTVQQAEIYPQTSYPITPIKIAGSYTKDNFNAAFNGVLGTPAVSGNLPVPTKLYLGYNQSSPVPVGMGHIRKLVYYPVALSTKNLQALTSQ